MITYWINKLILAVAFWLLVLLVLFLVTIVYSVIYCVYAKNRIEEQQEQERRRQIEERYRDREQNADAIDSEDSNQNESVDSSVSQSRAVLNHLIESMKKSFTIKHKYSKHRATSWSICFVDFVNKDIVIELKWDTKHTFHDAWLYSWTREHDTCPLWRKRIVQE